MPDKERFAAVLDAGRKITAALSQQAVFEAVQDAAVTLLGARNCQIVDPPAPGRGAPSDATYSTALLRRALFSGAPVTTELPKEAALAAPLFVRGQALAFLYATRPIEEGPFAEEEARLASFIAALAGAALENAAGFREVEARIEARTRELSAALKELRAAQSRLVHQGRMASLGQLVAAVTHEIANPLNFTLNGGAELSRRHETLAASLEAWAQKNGEDPDVTKALKELRAAKRSIDLILSGNRRIKDVIEALRAYVRGGIVAAEPADLITGIESTLALVRPQLRSQHILVVRAFEPLPQVVCRAGELNQVFMNLILNACQAMPSGGELKISTRETPEGVEIAFSDTGPGVLPEIRDQIFDPFFTTRAGEGTGLGLSISHEIVARHGGRLILADQSPGATFIVTLPLEPPPDSLPTEEEARQG